jgi:hypothetical protein
LFADAMNFLKYAMASVFQVLFMTLILHFGSLVPYFTYILYHITVIQQSPPLPRWRCFSLPLFGCCEQMDAPLPLTLQLLCIDALPFFVYTVV